MNTDRSIPKLCIHNGIYYYRNIMNLIFSQQLYFKDNKIYWGHDNTVAYVYSCTKVKAKKIIYGRTLIYMNWRQSCKIFRQLYKRYIYCFGTLVPSKTTALKWNRCGLMLKPCKRHARKKHTTKQNNQRNLMIINITKQSNKMPIEMLKQTIATSAACLTSI